jgi:hypothetical protein
MIRLVLIFIIVFLIIRAFVIAGSSDVADNSGGEAAGDKMTKKRGVSKEIGEYIEFEEIKKER